VALGGVTQFGLPGGRQPFLARAAGGRIWFVDQSNKLTALITANRTVFTFTQLPSDTIIRALAVSPNYVYAIDSHAGLTVFSITAERATTQSISFLPANSVIVATSLDDRLWFAKAGGHEIFSYEPRLQKVDVVEIADASLSALAADDGGRIWFANESRKSLGYYDTLSARVVEFPVARRGNVTALLPSAGTIWAGTDTGELLSTRANQLALSASVGAPITALAIGPGGIWYVAGSSAGVVFAPLSGALPPRVAPGSVRSLTFDEAGEAWLSDPSAALFYVIDTGVRQ
jgi:streptogramin lyase